MAVSNYVNPESMYPLKTGDTNSPAFGSGTVPGSFLAAALLPQRLEDYRGALDASMESSRLANLHSGAELQDYLSGQGSRTAGYNLKQGEAENASALLPGQRTLAMGSQQADIQKAPVENEMKVWGATSHLKQAQRDAVLKEMTTAGDLLRGIPDGADPALKIQFLKSAGIDTSHLEGPGMSPDVQSQHLQFLKNLDPKVFEHLSKMELGQQTGKYGVEKARVMAAGRVEAAKVRANIAKEIGAGKINEQQLFMMFNDAVAKDPEQRDDQEQALVDHYEDYRSLYAGHKADVTEKAQSKLPADKLEKLKEMDQKQQWKEKYDEVQTYQGKHWGLKKGKQGGTQADWEKLD